MGAYFPGARGLDRERVMDGWRQGSMIWFGCAASFKFFTRKQYLVKTHTTIRPNGSFCCLGIRDASIAKNAVWVPDFDPRNPVEEGH